LHERSLLIFLILKRQYVFIIRFSRQKVASAFILKHFIILLQGKMESVLSLLEIHWMVLIDIDNRDERGLSIVQHRLERLAQYMVERSDRWKQHVRYSKARHVPRGLRCARFWSRYVSVNSYNTLARQIDSISIV